MSIIVISGATITAALAALNASVASLGSKFFVL